MIDLTLPQELLLMRLRHEGAIPFYQVNKNTFRVLERRALAVKRWEPHPEWGGAEGYVVRLPGPRPGEDAA